MIAGFPWYDLPHLHWANDAIWRATGFPGELERHIDYRAQWFGPDLLLSQACSLDLFLSAAPIEPVAAPIFDLDAEPGTYYSHLVGDRGGRVAAVNSLSSRSGLSALLRHCQPEVLLVTGSHTESLAAIRQGNADVAAIDAVTWCLLAQHEPAIVEGVNIFDRSISAPAPPFVTRRGAANEPIVQALVNAFQSPATEAARQALCLKGVMTVDRAFYEPVLTEYQQVADALAACEILPRRL